MIGDAASSNPFDGGVWRICMDSCRIEDAKPTPIVIPTNDLHRYSPTKIRVSSSLPARKRWSTVEFDEMLSRGREDQSFIDAKVECSVCGVKADKQLSPLGVPYGDARHWLQLRDRNSS